jgi:type IV pilus assembly protein PilM
MNFDIFKPKTPPLFGLDISSSSVKMLEIVESGKGYVVERHAIEPLPKDAGRSTATSTTSEAVADAVKRGHKRLGTRTKHVAMAVPSGAVITKKIVVSSALREEDLEVQVQTEANQYIPFALEEVNLDFQVIGSPAGKPEDQEVLIAATRKEKVEDRVAVADSAGPQGDRHGRRVVCPDGCAWPGRQAAAESRQGPEHRGRRRRRERDERDGAA